MFALLLSLAAWSAEPPTPSAITAWSKKHPLSAGVRGGYWAGDYQSGGFGGHLDLRMHQRLGIQTYADVFLSLTPELHRRDHIIGFDLYAPLGRAEKHWFAPTFGTCVDFRMFNQPNGGPSAQDVRFGVHAGAKGRFGIYRGLAVEVIGTFTTYFGKGIDLEGWTTSTSSKIQVEPVGQFTTAISYMF